MRTATPSALMSPNMTGPEIKAIRERLGLTGQAFAALINQHIPGAGVNRFSVSRWESGRIVPSPAMAAIIRRLVANEP